MKIEITEPNQAVLVIEPGDLIALVRTGASPNDAVIVQGPDPLPESGEMKWVITEDDVYSWAYIQDGRVYFVGHPEMMEPGCLFVFVNRIEKEE